MKKGRFVKTEHKYQNVTRKITERFSLKKNSVKLKKKMSVWLKNKNEIKTNTVFYILICACQD